MTRWIVILGFAAGTAAAGCGSSGESCGVTAPASCPTTPPSYKTDVAPILETYCTKCHQPGGQESMKPLDTYQGISALSADVNNEISGCDMPPADQTQPTAAEREKVLAWILCGAQDN